MLEERVHNEYVTCRAELTKYGMKEYVIEEHMPHSLLEKALDLSRTCIAEINGDQRYTILESHWSRNTELENKVGLTWMSEELQRNFSMSFMGDLIQVNVQLEDTRFLTLVFNRSAWGAESYVRMGEENTGRAICTTCVELYKEYNK